MTEAILDRQNSPQSHSAALDRITQGSRFAIRLPIVGDVGVPSPEHVAYYAALGLLAVFEVIEWPVAVAIAVGHALAEDQHHRALHEVGEALESV
ncbi:hypothetical protein EGT67_17320 [Prescottella agglutinans]|uniref:Uncharacterized protein n=1 Tax=Prescottella agglutinans TaxID=1644129 RepID=A0A438BB92_9NOCA|nr:hypothetical protein [Prescottella agglutinans]RVW08171.1 hypothetical protein EGT67_17320 [Prescottella agglutinans]